MKLTIAVIALVLATISMAHVIEITARPDTGRKGVHVEGEHEH
jgi:hypothetical protein